VRCAFHLVLQLLLNEYSLTKSYFHRSQTVLGHLSIYLAMHEYVYDVLGLSLVLISLSTLNFSILFSLPFQNECFCYFILLPKTFLRACLRFLFTFSLYCESIFLNFFSVVSVSLSMITIYRKLVPQIII
jgi:hypothetical protein